MSDMREREERLLRNLENRNLSTEERLELEKELAKLQSSIRDSEKTQSVTDDRIIYSTINVELYEVIFPEIAEEPIVEEPELSFSDKLNDTTTSSVNGFIAFCQGFLLVVIRIAPVLIIIAVLGTAALLIYRRVRKYQLKQQQQQRINPEDENMD